MPHADSLSLPSDIISKPAFYEHLIETLSSLITPLPSPTVDYIQGNWITILSNTTSLLYGSFENFEAVWGKGDGRVNWCGFYLHPALFSPSTNSSTAFAELSSVPPVLLLGPFQGRPACLEVSLKGKKVGVCASAWIEGESQLVPDVELRPNHIACDSSTLSELVIPIIITAKDGTRVKVGVLDLDCEKREGFDEEDRIGLEKFVEVLVGLVRWGI